MTSWFDDKIKKQLRESWQTITESYKDEKSDSFCYMLYVLPEDEGQFTQMQKDLDLKGELTESGKFHITVRYVKDDNYTPLVNHLKGLELPVLKGKCKGFELFGKEKDALVIEMEGDELHNWFNKINDWLVENGFPKSDFPDYKPHITLTYDKGIEKPEWKKEYEKEVTFKLHVVTGSDYNEVFRLRV
jgi:2'-5' RNA ligase